MSYLNNNPNPHETDEAAKKANQEMDRIFNGDAADEGEQSPDLAGVEAPTGTFPSVNPQTASGINKNMS
ncbi:hypothetical protein SY83_13660 [Paenibacillus swuensis]|uniref:Uncharacterized protein n=1 Tax=Paenibacillus swuensis TaxID=1178515 RepID=A0A172TJ95_9BACL|nr:hypothetical protein [Paenibacillus swuensis]ANE47135.1 hypothetical protein SY83_13660 [Paenibacillus swuensis]